MKTVVGFVGALAVGLTTWLVNAPIAGASPESDFCRDMTAVGYTGECAAIVSLANDVCEEYDRGLDWETVVEGLDAKTGNEDLSNFIMAGAPMYFCPEHSGRV